MALRLRSECFPERSEPCGEALFGRRRFVGLFAFDFPESRQERVHRGLVRALANLYRKNRDK